MLTTCRSHRSILPISHTSFEYIGRICMRASSTYSYPGCMTMTWSSLRPPIDVSSQSIRMGENFSRVSFSSCVYVCVYVCYVCFMCLYVIVRMCAIPQIIDVSSQSIRMGENFSRVSFSSCMYVCVCVCMCVCIYVLCVSYVFVMILILYTYIYIYIYTYIYTCTYTHAYMYIHTCAYITRTHTWLSISHILAAAPFNVFPHTHIYTHTHTHTFAHTPGYQSATYSQQHLPYIYIYIYISHLHTHLIIRRPHTRSSTLGHISCQLYIRKRLIRIHTQSYTIIQHRMVRRHQIR